MGRKAIFDVLAFQKYNRGRAFKPFVILLGLSSMFLFNFFYLLFLNNLSCPNSTNTINLVSRIQSPINQTLAFQSAETIGSWSGSEEYTSRKEVDGFSHCNKVVICILLPLLCNDFGICWCKYKPEFSLLWLNCSGRDFPCWLHLARMTPRSRRCRSICQILPALTNFFSRHAMAQSRVPALPEIQFKNLPQYSFLSQPLQYFRI